MEGIDPVAPVEPIAPLVEAPDDSLAGHEASFGPGATPKEPVAPVEADAAAGERDDQGRFKHRAKSQQATPADAPRIAELTKKWRDAERRADEAERRASTRIPETDRRVEPAKPAASVSTFSEKEPTIEDFAADADPYASYIRALAGHDRKKAAFDAKHSEATEATNQAFRSEVDTYLERTRTFTGSKPDFDTVTADVRERHLPAPLLAAIVRHDNGPEFVYHLATHPDDLDELTLQSVNVPVTDAFVALLQRRLSTRMQAAVTGSAAPHRAPSPAPRPPNPVRTGPMTTGEDLPGDDSSLADHERAFGKKRTR